PPLRLHIVGDRPAITVEGQRLRELLYRTEAARGYDSVGDLWAPGYFQVDVTAERPATLIASTEPWDVLLVLHAEATFTAERRRRAHLLELAGPVASSPFSAELVLAADQFLITPVGRGEEMRTVIAGYPWFTDWGRDTMISLEGLTLTTGRH